MPEHLPVPHAIHRDGAGVYVIQVRGKVEHHWEPELHMKVSYDQTEHGLISTLSGTLPDQSSLLGALARLNMWGYLVLLVRYDPQDPSGDPLD